MHVEALGSSSLCSDSRTISKARGENGKNDTSKEVEIADHLVEMSSELHF